MASTEDYPRVHEVDDYKKFPVTYEVRVLVDGNNVKVEVGQNMIRTLTLDKLPDEIRSALAMIYAIGLSDEKWFVHPSLFNVGWYMGTVGQRPTVKKFVVIITAGLLDKLRGNALVV
jgi:hypothetical protein